MKFIIYVPNYDENSGGIVVLYKLCEVLKKIGHEALLWPVNRPSLTTRTPLSVLRWMIYYATRTYRPAYVRKPGSSLKFAKSADLSDGVVVYPEIFPGNRLGASKYLHWVLYKPGARFKELSKSTDRHLYFAYNHAFNEGCDGMAYGGVLKVVDIRRDIYRDFNIPGRSGACYIVRKGRTRADLPELMPNEVVDSLSHEELAEKFNRCEVCYFYDTYTMYSRYAALCGCVPVVVPELGVSKEDWMPDPDLRYGLAYGEDEIDFARETRDLLVAKLDSMEREGETSVERFVRVVQNHFRMS